MEARVALSVLKALRAILDEAQTKEALSLILETQRKQLEFLESIGHVLQTILFADLRAGRRHLELAQLQGRDRQDVLRDLRLARELFVRALGPTKLDGGRELLLQLEIEKEIAVCSILLDDYPVARHYLDDIDARIAPFEEVVRRELALWKKIHRTAVEAATDEGDFLTAIIGNRIQRDGRRMLAQASQQLPVIEAGLFQVEAMRDHAAALREAIESI